MKIAQLVSNLHTVSPLSSNAIYSHTAWLTNGLIDLGNEVTLFASGDSETNGNLVSVTSKSTASTDKSDRMKYHYFNLLISRCYQQAPEFDIIHSHFNLLSSFFSALKKETPTVQSFHSPVDKEIMPILKQFKDSNYYISFSLAQRRQMPELNWTANIYHGIDTQKFAYNPKPEKYLLYLGRITEEKGVHLAIEAAKAAKMPLVMAGRSYPNEGYWHDKIEKHIDGKNVRYIGEADFETKIKYLQNAKALIFPTQYDEVFGYVMIEAMSCGTPVIGWRKGSVPEVVSNKHTGYVVKNVDEAVKAIKAINKISRSQTRKRAEEYFSVEKMVSGYAKVYERILTQHNRVNGCNNV